MVGDTRLKTFGIKTKLPSTEEKMYTPACLFVVHC